MGQSRPTIGAVAGALGIPDPDEPGMPQVVNDFKQRLVDSGAVSLEGNSQDVRDYKFLIKLVPRERGS